MLLALCTCISQVCRVRWMSVQQFQEIAHEHWCRWSAIDPSLSQLHNKNIVALCMRLSVCMQVWHWEAILCLPVTLQSLSLLWCLFLTVTWPDGDSIFVSVFVRCLHPFGSCGLSGRRLSLWVVSLYLGTGIVPCGGATHDLWPSNMWPVTR